MGKNKKIIFIAVGFVVSSMIILSSIAINGNFFSLNKVNSKDDRSNETMYITVRIDGAVFYPGDYTLKLGSTLNDLLIKSKPKYGANLSNINRTEILKDNQKIYIRLVKNIKKSVKEFKNVNDLISIGVRKKIAGLIIAHLVDNNYNTTWENIEKIDGIGEKTLKLLQNNILL
ncbi:hypothetical protein HGG64_02955 [Mycoplasma phocoeninasale]|uniref:Soluble ligand binding domain-containing protein n=1 Tax=Mycoplasma phocoeninasale TaxID=2726117 RepID=A0A858U3R4_9MOLU|nr:hypothetical protein [Mycoplasma phocoeninasale]QJG66641.1 hypothetical protein HGG64_02955 [Mycoplasma phocoeninasale]